MVYLKKGQTVTITSGPEAYDDPPKVLKWPTGNVGTMMEIQPSCVITRASSELNTLADALVVLFLCVLITEERHFTVCKNGNVSKIGSRTCVK